MEKVTFEDAVSSMFKKNIDIDDQVIAYTYADFSRRFVSLEKATEGAAGFDFCTPEEFTLSPGEKRLIKTNIKLLIPKGWKGQLFSKSGLCLKYSIITLAGTIDSDYRGEVGVILYMLPCGEAPVTFAVGDKISQIVFERHHPSSKLFLMTPDQYEKNTTLRGEGGFGSTGK